MVIKRTILGLFFIGCFASGLLGQSLAEGQWQGVIDYDGQSVPFEFEVYKTGEKHQVAIINGEERKLVDASVKKDSITMSLGVFDTEIRAHFTESSMTGVWVKHYRGSSIPFRATKGKKRYTGVAPSSEVAGKWSISFMPPVALAYPGVGLWKQEGNKISGTVMTEVSDFRYFEGIVSGDSIKLSSFDGAHAFLMLGVKTSDGWQGEFHFDNGYKEDWVAKPDPEAQLQDPWQMVDIEPRTHRPFFDILAAGSGPGAIDESLYFDKVLVIQLFGTWCPNSLDESHYLSDWYNENRNRDVEILAVSYEANYSREYGERRINQYKEGLEIPYDMVLGGRLSKGQAALAFPFMDKIKAFPTLVIVDKQGYVRYVHSYFNGPATGDYYKAFDEKFNEIIDSLLAEE